MFTPPVSGALTISFEGTAVMIGPFLLVLLLGLVVILPPALFRRWYFYRQRLKKSVITAEYDPPLSFNPAEIGYLFDGKLREREVGATIIHLMQRGLLHVKKSDGQKRIYAGPRVSNSLKSYEAKLVAEADKPDGISGEDLLQRFTSIKTAYLEMAQAPKPFVFTQLVHADLEKNQYVKGSSVKTFLWGSLKITLLMLLIITVVPLLLLWGYVITQNGVTDFAVLGAILMFTIFLGLFFIFPLFLAAMVLNFVRGRIVGREWIITPKLEHLWPQIVGYRQYVQLVERDRLEFQTNHLKEMSKSITLPYAVALGFVKNWRSIIC